MTRTGRILSGQLLVLALCAYGFWAVSGEEAARAAVYGCITAIANAALLLVRMRSDWRRQGADAQRHLRFFFRSSIERFAVVVSLLIIGLAGLGLSPLHVIAGFVAGQVVFLAASISIQERE
ncbi:ATP synthase subunit I [Rhodocyclus tenuis]|uniref:ATP synthase subunit I n=2 Tax=Rhodocyclus TaxID=1064 RepID=A0A6L5JZA7_RHOTE|nr:ATP synthase subunit I [Rhodocyclus gracilis]MQY52426.1 hypothetical protein [Rhodocyclus gracilis]MRD73562.1 hypothetical protein [Rhodocyclus gracilis]NJA88328.1 ATP synthase subunit I [Rhodocyclus gracilis]